MPAVTRLLLAAACAVLLSLVPAAAARADSGPVDPRGADVTTALRLATQQWGVPACDGAVEVRWTAGADAGLNAVASWALVSSDARSAARRTACVIALNPRASWDWPKLCTVLVHEAGHLLGHEHGEGGLMAPVYGAPLAACAATPEPQGAFTAAPAAPAPAPAAPAPAPGAVAPVAAASAAAFPAVDDEQDAAAPRSAIEAAAFVAAPVRSRSARRSGRAGQRRGRAARRATPRAARTR